ncbi:hypothetical protein B0J11DRAFT_516025 [Dendryphion nanum]|uniref:Uncharacterized protein n=1 Tax=Dendryphion nanum TaxID=256645 RepID=A0A9P9EL29_9PLEO|nr:hypothetical protein B0J11DRAFT_516025 [Dendryphion nanum]
MGLHDGTKYSPLNNEEQYIPTQTTTRRYRFLIICATSIALVFSLLQLLLTVDVRMRVSEEARQKPLKEHKHTTSPPESEWPCGITAAEARKAGCLFDLGLVAWLPPACYNKELDDHFRAANPWEFWLPNDDNTGPNITKPITTEAQLQELPVQMIDEGWPGHSWSTMANHDAHCMHTWEYLHQAVLKGKRVPSLIVKFEHTAHCTHAALIDTSNLTYQETSPRAHGRYPACLELESLKGEMLDWY